MNVYIKDPAVTQVKIDQKVPLIWFVANVGGILGLTMGMSLVTFFEILHHVAIMFFRTGAKSIATVRRTMTASSSFQMRKNREAQTKIDNHNNSSSITAADEIIADIGRLRRQQSKSLDQIDSIRVVQNGGKVKKKCLTVFMDPSGEPSITQ